ncbi:DUF5714 domain-containing protein [Anaerovorax odorimutans]|uniref:DUF5714 domain-containing protein n=1 Tax=Anaerovorax odorimutans TaxID=109327 RepID=UPI000409B804|nr:DUF5714 domain-containing protein [Anaerovorax odorimutans]
MGTKNTECLICGDKIIYSDEVQDVVCHICGNKFKSNAICENGHFVCDKCHSNAALDKIIEFCLETKEKDATIIVQDLMRLEFVHMHGPEHHYLVAAALLTAYNNNGYGDKFWNLNKALKEAKVRASVVPGGVCAFWGCCGAAISAGIFAAIIAKVNPLSKEERGNVNLLTSIILERISKDEGPRCCKRECFSSVLITMEFASKTWDINLGDTQSIKCTFYPNNNQCKGKACQYRK